MNKPSISIFGLGAGSDDDISLGTVRRLKELSVNGTELLLRTEVHPSIPFLQSLGVVFTRSFDDVYESSVSFDDVYSAIAKTISDKAVQRGRVAYVVPGHPLVGERTVALLLEHEDAFDITVYSGRSFVDAVLASARCEVNGLVVLDALSLPDLTNPYRAFTNPFNLNSPHLIYQVYDRATASLVKLCLLEQYPAEFLVKIIDSAGIPEQEKVTETSLGRLDFSENRFNHLTTVFIPRSEGLLQTKEFSTLLDIMAKLRDPATGCPWDREQTPETLKRYAVEEVYEVIDAIDDGDVDKYVEELGDLLLQVAFHAQLARESGDFTIGDVISSISEKLIRRHPHVFGDVSVNGADEVLVNWEKIKRAEKGNSDRKSRLDGVPRHLPSLAQAMEISKRAAKAGFEWDSIDGVLEKLDEEILELKEALAEGNHNHIVGELGDLLFTIVNIARFTKIDAEDALRKMVKRFSARFKSMELAAGIPIENLDLASLESLWQQAKREELR